jgi:coenzyme F420 biosynthesis associated uncharacterized protein
MTSAPSPIDWRRAEQIAVVVASRTPAPPASIAREQLSAMATLAEERVEQVTGLRAPPGGTITVIDRPDWIRANIATFRKLLAPLVEQWPQQRTGASLTGAAAGAELGLLMGWMSTRVLGQFDLLVGGPEDDAVYLVGPNLARLEQQFGFDPDGFRLWVLLHELTHRAQFTGVPWMREHFSGLVEQSVRFAAPDPAALLAALRDALRNPFTANARVRDHGMIGLVAGPEQRAVLHQVGGLMSLLEGHGDVTMDRAGEGLVPDAERFGFVLRERRRRATPPARLVQRLLGFEAKLEQYAAGARFIAEIEAHGGPRVVDRCWSAPEMLPTLDEIRRPSDWLARCGVPELARGAA